MSAKETIIIHDLSAEKGPSTMEAVVDQHVAVHLGFLAAAGPVFRKATAEEVATHKLNHPEAHARLRQVAEDNLAERASWGVLPTGYEPLSVVENTDAA